MNMDVLSSAIGRSVPRVDGRPKVTGSARFAADVCLDLLDEDLATLRFEKGADAFHHLIQPASRRARAGSLVLADQCDAPEAGCHL